MTLKHHIKLTNGTDTAVAGQLFQGNNGAITSLFPVAANNDTITAGLQIVGLVPLPTLNSSDIIDLERTNGSLGTNNTMNAVFNVPQDITPSVIGVTTLNVQVESIFSTGFPNTVTIEGGFTTSSRFGNLLPNWDGLSTVNMNNSGAGAELNLGSIGTPLQVLVPNIMATNDPGAFPTILGTFYQPTGIFVTQAASLFGSSISVNVTLNAVGSAAPASANALSDDYIHGVNQAFVVQDGPDSGSAGVVNWTITSSGGVNNYMFLDSGGATSTNMVTFTGGANLTVFADGHQKGGPHPGEWANMTTIAGSGMTGNLILTGGLNDTNGFLNGAFKLNNLTTGSGNDWVDESSFTLAQIQAETINLGAGTNTLVLAGQVLTGLTAPLTLMSNVERIGWGGSFGEGPAPGGTINWADLPSTATSLIFYHGISGGAGLTINNAPAVFSFNQQDEDFHNNNITIHGDGTSLTVILGSAVGEAHGDHSVWTVTGYPLVTIDAIDVDHFATGGEVKQEDPLPPAFADVTGSGPGVVHVIGNASFDWGASFYTERIVPPPVGPSPFFSTDTAFAIGQIGDPSISIGEGGTITDTDSGVLTIASTDAGVINAGGGGGLVMNAPDTDFDAVVVIGSSGADVRNLLQGSLSPLASSFNDDFSSGGRTGDGAPNGIDGLPVGAPYQGFNFAGNNGNDQKTSDVYFGFGGGDTINAGKDVGDNVFTTGGASGIPGSFNQTTVNLQNTGGGDVIWYNQFEAGPVGGGIGQFSAPLAIFDDFGTQLSGGLVTINGFVPGATNGYYGIDPFSGNTNGAPISGADSIVFAIASWGQGGTLSNGDAYDGLVYIGDPGIPLLGNENGHIAHYASLSPGSTVFADGTDFGIFGGITFANAAELATDLHNGVASFGIDPTSPFVFPSHTEVSELIAYNVTGTNAGVNIASVQFDNTSGIGQKDTEDVTVHAVDLIHLTGSITAQELGHANIYFA